MTHESDGLARANQERLGLRVHGVVPRLETDFHRLLVELRRLRSRVRDEDVERAERLSNLPEHPVNVFHARDIGLDQESVGAVLSHSLQGFLGGGLVGVIMDGDARPGFGELERDSPPDAP